jgi:hypothetical protein
LTDKYNHKRIIQVYCFLFSTTTCFVSLRQPLSGTHRFTGVSKEAAQKFEGGRFNLRKLYQLDVRKPYQIEITNRFAALENLSDGEDINRAWENIKENQNLS